MGERVKTFLLILFIAGVIGAFNSIVRLSQKTGQTSLQTITTVLGLTPKATPEPSRKFEYLKGQLAQPQGGFAPATSTPPGQRPSGSAASKSPSPSPSSVPSGIQTASELPPLPPLTNALGASDQTAPELPPLPPLNRPEPTLENQIQDFLEKAVRYFGF